MAVNLQKLNELIEFLKIHNNNVQSSKSLTVERIKEFAQEFEKERKKFLNDNIGELKRKIKKNYKKLRIPILSLMEYDFHENTHSNILEYLIDYNSFDKGAMILCDIIKDTSNTYKDDLCKKILKKTYEVDREYNILSGKGRIDLFIWDNKEKFIIIIENKILAEIGETIDEVENISVTQLEKYEKWCNENYPDSEYTKLYILLNFNNIDEDVFLFEKISYSQLFNNFKNLNKGNKIDDNVFDEYLLLLDTLLNNKKQDLSEIKKLASKITEDGDFDISKLSLTDYYTLKNIFYA